MYIVAQYANEIIVAVISALAGSILTWGYQEYTAKRKMLKERFDKLYAPFEKMVLLRKQGAHSFSDLDTELQKDLIHLLFDNYEYADTVLKVLVVQFKMCLDGKQKEDSDKNFFLIEHQVSQGFNKLSRKLYLEPFRASASKEALKKWDKLP